MAQTAVEWLVRELNQELNYIPITQWDRIRDIVQQAKVMEKEQIMEAYEQAHVDLNMSFRGADRSEQYYRESYGE